jgi:thiol:disulfide interchange protein DsbD
MLHKLAYFLRIFCAFTLISWPISSPALPTLQPLPADEAFKLSVEIVDQQMLLAQWKIQPGYYLFRDRIHFTTADKGTQLGTPVMPDGILKHNSILGQYTAFQDTVTISVPVTSSQTAINLQVHYQGCAEDGFCYPPLSKSFALRIAEPRGTLTPLTAPTSLAAQDDIAELLTQQGVIWIVLGFFGFGILLAFTPCVLPMVPILSAIILGQNQALSTRRAFVLSLLYVLSMAVTYAVAGVIAGHIGQSLQASLQQPLLLILFSGLFVLLALSLFDVFPLRLPNALQQSINRVLHSQRGGRYLSVILMGILATLITSPCVTPPLVGALLYIGQTGDALLGGTALFSLGLGMGIPLLLFGTFGAALLPKAGAWMQTIKALFGVLLLGVAIWILARVFTDPAILLLWALLAIGSALYLGIFQTPLPGKFARLQQALGYLLFIYGITLVVGAAMGNRDPWQPLQFSHTTNNAHTLFTRIKTTEELQQYLTQAKQTQQTVILDFFAQWCATCHEIERDVFRNPEVQQALSQFTLLQADVTANDLIDKALQKQFNVIAPPAILFFDPQGKELTQLRIVGRISADEMLQRLQQLERK